MKRVTARLLTVLAVLAIAAGIVLSVPPPTASCHCCTTGCCPQGFEPIILTPPPNETCSCVPQG
jgi:hypothetical protein